MTLEHGDGARHAPRNVRMIEAVAGNAMGKVQTERHANACEVAHVVRHDAGLHLTPTIGSPGDGRPRQSRMQRR